MTGFGWWCHRGVTGSTQWPALNLHLLLLVVIEIVSLLEGVLGEPWITVYVIQMEDGRTLGLIQVY